MLECPAPSCSFPSGLLFYKLSNGRALKNPRQADERTKATEGRGGDWPAIAVSQQRM